VKTTTTKKGSVTVHTINGKLRIRLPHQKNGKQPVQRVGRYQLKTPFYRKQVMIIALTIESDIESQKLDTSLENYETIK
jgi:hypothetical protein